MSNPGEAHFVAHCTEPSCDLGGFEYHCPLCECLGKDYDQVWDQADAILAGTHQPFTCECCKGPLIMTWDAEECEYRVLPGRETP